MGQRRNQRIKNYMETNGNDNTTDQNLWAAEKPVLTRKFTAIQACLKKQEKGRLGGSVG